MGKVIFWIVVVFVLLFALRLWNSAKARARSGAAKAPPDAAKMVQCAGCGVFLPAPDARVTAEGYRCSDPKCAGNKPR